MSIILPLLLGFLCSVAVAQQTDTFFQQNCTSCHTIGGGRLTGPDLKDATKRKERAWLEKFIQAPKAVIDSGDPYALQLQQESRGIVMPAVPGVTPQMAKALVDLIEAESALPKSRFAGAAISDRPFTPANVALGMEILRGERKLSQGGAACISCHTIGTLRGMGGGRLGPDLTLVWERLGGRKAIGAWLTNPLTPTMQAVYRNHRLQNEEIFPLLAVFDEAARTSLPADSGAQVNFFLAGFAGLCGALGLMGWIWRGRFTNVRRNLVRKSRGVE
ncbi:MAG: cytochrome c [Acidobacteria bacterium]|nr:cytochrome c [Acidobacteriota bacterium]